MGLAPGSGLVGSWVAISGANFGAAQGSSTVSFGGTAATANLLTGLHIDERFQRADASGPANFLTDVLGSTIALTGPSGNTLAQYTYDPYGNTTMTGSSSNPYQFTGRENDGTGLYYYRARCYSPQLEKFLSEDPIGFDGGTNKFADVGNNPVNWVGPFGLVKCVYITEFFFGGWLEPALACVSDDYSQKFMTRNVWSGYGICRNNPSCAPVLYVGPIPAGHYSLGGVGQTPRPYNPQRIPIVSPHGKKPYGRAGFEFHPGRMPTSSQGCIVMARPDYDRFVKFYKTDNRGSLMVMDWLDVLP
jgi:RHS repeat-associated protein